MAREIAAFDRFADKRKNRSEKRKKRRPHDGERPNARDLTRAYPELGREPLGG
jgi:hypothetical protein